MQSARDISDGGVAVTLAQAAFAPNIGARVEQEQALMVHPLFGLFAEPATTVILSADPRKISEIEKIAEHFDFNVARIGTTGGDRLEISVYGDIFISASLAELRSSWANSLEAALHNEVRA
jgi:phosphoribosylformylglycinamidine synthase